MLRLSASNAPGRERLSRRGLCHFSRARVFGTLTSMTGLRPRMHHRLRVITIALACSLTIPAVARADGPAPSPSAAPAPAPAAAPAPADGADAERATTIRRRGDEEMVNGRAAEALAAYSEAYALTKDPALLYNKGRAFEAMGDYPSALEQIEEFDRVGTPELKARVPGLARLLAELRQKVSQIAIVCDVDGATVRLRDRKLGVTPITNVVRVHAGTGTLEITKEGYYPYKRELPLPPAGLASVEVHLSSRASSGLLRVASSVAGARVTIDGKPAGTVPTEVVLQAGTHSVQLDRDGYKPATSSVLVTAGENKSVDIGLEAEAPITKKWWFWTGIGVVVLGGTATVIALTSERDAGSGTIAPGRITAGLSGLSF